jgi:hypothetical protein
VGCTAKRAAAAASLRASSQGNGLIHSFMIHRKITLLCHMVKLFEIIVIIYQTNLKPFHVTSFMITELRVLCLVLHLTVSYCDPSSVAQKVDMTDKTNLRCSLQFSCCYRLPHYQRGGGGEGGKIQLFR